MGYLRMLFSWLVTKGMFGSSDSWTDYWAQWIMGTLFAAGLLAFLKTVFNLVPLLPKIKVSIFKWWFLTCPIGPIPLLIKPFFKKTWGATVGKKLADKKKLEAAMLKVEEDQYKAIIKEEQAKLRAAQGGDEDAKSKAIRAAFAKKIRAAEKKQVKKDAKQAHQDARSATPEPGPAPLSPLNARQAKIAARKEAVRAKIAERQAKIAARQQAILEKKARNKARAMAHQSVSGTMR